MELSKQVMSIQMEACIQECQSCHSICESTITHCLKMGGKHAEASQIGLLRDCAQICATSADFMLRSSPQHDLTCGVCAQVCERCAEHCEQFADDPLMRQCAEACRACAVSCREMALGM